MELRLDQLSEQVAPTMGLRSLRLVKTITNGMESDAST